MKKAVLLLVFIIFSSSSFAGAVSVWEKVSENDTILAIYVRGNGFSTKGSPPIDPFNGSYIEEISIHYPYNTTHYLDVYYMSGKWRQTIERFFPGNRWMPKVPFKLSDWNLSKVLSEYQWGVKNYLPNVTGKYWYKGYWNSSIARWKVELNATTFKVILDGGHCGECEQYITFQCSRNGTNVTCQWGKPIMRDITPPWAPKNTITSTTKEENTICGPALMVGLALIPVLKRRKSQ